MCTFEKNILSEVLNSVRLYSNKTAFFIENENISYADFGKNISKIRSKIQSVEDVHIGLVANNDIETYASIFALWLEGKCYIPLHPEQPLERCIDIITQVGINVILDSSEYTRYSDKEVILTSKLEYNTDCLELNNIESDDALAYILFTSGSTGKPKGVTLSRNNLMAFVNAFWKLGYVLDCNDRCLQMFDLTFDLSVQSYLIPLMVGACVYTVPSTKLKYGAVFELLDEQRLTFTLMVPSIIHYLRPYMDEIFVPEMKYSLFCGEALPLDVTNDWSKCVPNARIDNVYGPTEDTIYCTAYTYKRETVNKASNGILCIGKTMDGNEVIIVDENLNILPVGEIGELCLAGKQLTPGYWKNNEKNQESFFVRDNKRFYKTGDLCCIDDEGDIFYHGRKDFQVKVQGYRIELGEIECHAREYLKNKNLVTVPYTNNDNNTEISLFVESKDFDANELYKYLKSKLPTYMLPSKIIGIDKFPLNSNGKVNRKELKKKVE